MAGIYFLQLISTFNTEYATHRLQHSAKSNRVKFCKAVQQKKIPVDVHIVQSLKKMKNCKK